MTFDIRKQNKTKHQHLTFDMTGGTGSSHSGGEQRLGQKNISLEVHTLLETSMPYISEAVDETIWHWDLLEKSAKTHFNDCWVKIRL